ncbi:hypothetical protein BKA65DRAFT_547859 [Rhexocercosporidium sp. MPI-PUGE-AT-0058]|nr:hypothetical protein BKA65DRAFT_547859 [Rhexocercosporidium sp. MPI-PUGE-AT-0058]
MSNSTSTSSTAHPSHKAETTAAVIGFSISMGLPALTLIIIAISVCISKHKKKRAIANSTTDSSNPNNANYPSNAGNGAIFPFDAQNMGILGRQVIPYPSHSPYLSHNRHARGDDDEDDDTSGWDADSEGSVSILIPGENPISLYNQDPEAGHPTPPPAYAERWDDIELGVMPARAGSGNRSGGECPPGYFATADLRVDFSVNLSLRIERPAVEQ